VKVTGKVKIPVDEISTENWTDGVGDRREEEMLLFSFNKESHPYARKIVNLRGVHDEDCRYAVLY
jgi:hypothetical protein